MAVGVLALLALGGAPSVASAGAAAAHPNGQPRSAVALGHVDFESLNHARLVYSDGGTVYTRRLTGSSTLTLTVTAPRTLMTTTTGKVVDALASSSSTVAVEIAPENEVSPADTIEIIHDGHTTTVNGGGSQADVHSTPLAVDGHYVLYIDGATNKPTLFDASTGVSTTHLPHSVATGGAATIGSGNLVWAKPNDSVWQQSLIGGTAYRVMARPARAARATFVFSVSAAGAGVVAVYDGGEDASPRFYAARRRDERGPVRVATYNSLFLSASNDGLVTPGVPNESDTTLHAWGSKKTAVILKRHFTAKSRYQGLHEGVSVWGPYIAWIAPNWSLHAGLLSK